MNKKIVFSLVLLSAFSCLEAAPDNRQRLYIGDHISGINDYDVQLAKCLYGNNHNDLDSCAKLRKIDDDLYVHCIPENMDLTDSDGKINSSYFHISNILNQKDSSINPEKVRYEALRQCGVSYYDSRTVQDKKLGIKYVEGVNKGIFIKDFNDFVDRYKKIINDKFNSTKGVCKEVFRTELDYLNNKTSINDVDFTAYYNAIGFKPSIVNLQANNVFAKSNIELYSVKLNSKDTNNINRKVLQEYYKEFSSPSTGRLMVNSKTSNTNSEYSVYLLEQNDFNIKNNSVFKGFANLIADKTYSTAVGGYGESCADLYNTEPLSLKYGRLNTENQNIDRNKLVYLDETFKDSEAYYGACDMYKEYIKLSLEPFERDRFFQAILLKNSKIKYIDGPFDYLADYNDKPNYRVNDYAGGVSKCYNYDYRKYKSDFERMRYFNWNYNTKEIPYRINRAKDTKLQTYMFSIHKSNGARKGIYKDENTIYNFSVNFRPLFRPQGHMTHISFDAKFIPDANTCFITDMANQSTKTEEINLKVTNLNDVYIHLGNTYLSEGYDLKNRENPNTKVQYFLTGVSFTKKQTYNSEKEVNGRVETIPVGKIELVKKNTDGFGLGFKDDALYDIFKIAKDEINKGNVYELTFEPTEILERITETNTIEVCPEISGVCKLTTVDEVYERPIFQTTGKDIIKGKQIGSATIILGKGQMPKVTFGTAYNSHEDNGEVIKNGLAYTEIANKFYTRTNKQSIYLGFNPVKSYTLNKQYVKFFDRDINDSNKQELKNIEIFNSLGRVNIDNVRCKGYYPISGKMVVKLNSELNVGQGYKFSYEVAEYDDYNKTCDVLGGKSSNEFTIRPEEIEYKVAGEKSFKKNAGKVDGKFIDNNVVFTSNKNDDRFGIGIAELRVEYAEPLKGNKIFNLEDKNTNLLNKVDNTTTSFVDFDNTKGEFAIKTIFPMVTDARILLAENKFTYEDLKNGLCSNYNSALNKNEANKIGTDGKINCQTPGNEIDVNFTASQSLSFEKDAVNKEIKAGVTNTNFINYVPFSDLDGERLRIPLQIANTNNGTYFYKRYDSDSVTAEINLTYKTEPKELKEVIIKATSDLDVKGISQNQFKLSGLNAKFNDKLTALNIADKLSSYNDADFDAKNFAKLEYKIGYPKTKADGSPRLEREFEISNADSKITFATGKEEPKNSILDNSYKFAYTGLFFKDINSNETKGALSYEIKAKNAGLLKYVENKGFEKIDDKNVNDFERLYNNAIGSFNLISDYSKEALNKNNYKIPAKLSDNQYVKDTIRFDIKDSAYKYLDSFSTFTIEFIK